MAMNVDGFYVTSVDMASFFDNANNLVAMLDEIQDATISNTQENNDITGKNGAVIGTLKRNKAVNITINNGLIVAGEIGRIVSDKVPPAGASAGCQAECGLASSMASAALTFLSGGNTDMVLNSVALALKNILGLTCDPVLGLVEVPCVKRNPFLAQHAITASYLALSGIKSKIPLDEVVDAMKETGLLMSPKLKESSEAGLAVVKSALSFKKDNIIS